MYPLTFCRGDILAYYTASELCLNIRGPSSENSRTFVQKMKNKGVYCIFNQSVQIIPEPKMFPDIIPFGFFTKITPPPCSLLSRFFKLRMKQAMPSECMSNSSSILTSGCNSEDKSIKYLEVEIMFKYLIFWRASANIQLSTYPS